MKLTVITPNGVLYNEDVDYIVVSSKNNGDFAILENHAPVISTIDVGYLKLVKDQKNVFTVIINGVLEQQDNYINVIAQEAHVGLNKDSAMEHLNSVRKERLEENRKRTMDFLMAEQELKKAVKNAKASRR
ncbi:MAG: ATP synthase F1 subunit epsilon [Candidatus Izemoplasmataceae bacterium]|jgi:F-type H+-transporting ATPase subunit epsilon|uniref:ATP synthase F1 subunit epsilon n=1 Tax=Liberiplasma polymorphum TaxID=3374570 RepID=UPI00377225A1